MRRGEKVPNASLIRFLDGLHSLLKYTRTFTLLIQRVWFLGLRDRQLTVVMRYKLFKNSIIRLELESC